MPDQRNLNRAAPHRVPWYMRMLGLAQRQSHPVPADLDDPIDFMGDVAEWWERQFRLAGDRRERYRIFDEMDTFGLVMGILDVYAEETTQPDYDKQRSVWIESKSQKMIQAGEECLRNCQVEDRMTPIVRRIAKYGDAFQRLLYQTGKGVLGWRYVSAAKVHRLEDKYGRLIGFREDGKKFRAKKRAVSWPWDYLHFRLLGKDEEQGYGTAMLEPMFRPWRQLTLAEDSMLMYRLRRAPDRNMVFVDVGDMEEHEAMQYVNAWRKKFRKTEFVDPASPNYKKQYNPLSPLEDIWLPIRPDQNSRVEQLSGSGNVGEVHDVEYFRRKFFGSAKVPQAYFGFEGDINAKATLMQQDVRFARTAKRLRKSAIYGLRQLLDMHYVLLPEEANDQTYDFTKEGNEYIVQMSPIAYLDEFERLELIQLRYQIVDSMSRLANDMNLDAKVWVTYVLLHYAKLPEDLVLKLINKTPPGPMAQQPGGEQMGPESITPAMTQVLNECEPERRADLAEALIVDHINGNGRIGAGFYNVDAKEARLIAEAVHQSAGLRHSIFRVATLFSEDAQIIQAQTKQTDPSLVPVMTKGVLLEDEFEDDKHAKELQEDLKGIGAVTEGEPEPEPGDPAVLTEG